MIKTMRLCDRCGREITGGIYYTVTACMIAEHLTKTEMSVGSSTIQRALAQIREETHD